jgi:chemotaxis signal transduction protein
VEATDFQSGLENDKINTHFYRYGFSIAGHHILQDTSIASQYNKIEKLYQLPRTVDWFCGMIIEHNVLIPLYDISKLFNSEKHSLINKDYALTMNIEGKYVGLLIDDEPKLIADEIKPISFDSESVPELLSNAHKDTYRVGNKNWIEFSFQKLFCKLSGQSN